jgi:para-aminobenzoate synthetase component 1
MNRLGAERIPFLFILSYDKTRLYVQPLEQVRKDGIGYKLESRRNTPAPHRAPLAYRFRKYPGPYATYLAKFRAVEEQIRAGNTYLLNLTDATPIETDLSLETIFRYSRARFKLHLPGQFVCFSPERFVETDGDVLATYPMKGTIDAHLPDAKRRLLENPKELAEHVMIVDLMRNDLGQVGRRVRVERFRYVERIHTGTRDLLQTSSHITARLPADWRDRIGTLIDRLTPAGSITGTPKHSTVRIIREVEGYDRGFYTGVFGLFDGHRLQSAVLIRFIERSGDTLLYKSGGGITLESDPRSEYEELIDKIYLSI